MTEREEYTAKWNKVYADMKAGAAVAPILVTNSHRENAEAIRNILAQMAIDIAALEQKKD